MKIISEGPIKITRATIDAAWRRRATAQRLVMRDKDCRGLSLIVNATSMAWSYAYRPRGIDTATGRRWPNKTVTLGNPATHSPDDARVEANRIKGQTAGGIDPAADRKAKLAADQKSRSSTLGRLFDAYKRALPKRQKMRGSGKPSPDYIEEEIAQTRMALDGMKAVDKPAADLTAADVRAMLDAAEGVTTARKRFGPLSRFLDWCQDEGHIQTNPCSAISRNRRPRTPQARSHYLKPAQLAWLWNAADKLAEPVWRDIARFLIAVPCRRDEAADVDWSHLDLAAAEWHQPDNVTKNGDPHRIHLHPLALDVLKARWQAWVEEQTDGVAAAAARLVARGQPRSGLVFPAPRSGKAIDTFTDIKAALVGATKPEDGDDGDALTGWTYHDFRRSFASALGEAGIPEAVADAVLNHRQAATRGGVLGVYQRSSRWPEQLKAMQLWGRLLKDAMDGEQANTNVVSIGARAG